MVGERCAWFHALAHELLCANWGTAQRGCTMTLSVARAQKRKQFDPKTFLSVIDGGRALVTFAKKKTIFLQGEPSNSVLYIQRGKVQLTVTSKTGKEAVIGLLKEGDFLGENCLTGEPLRLCSATALTDCSLMRIEKDVMIQALHEEPALSEIFVAYLLARNTQY
jgi:CRP/FNR family cyclic AMP-dependent transcriptional regulator